MRIIKCDMCGKEIGLDSPSAAVDLNYNDKARSLFLFRNKHMDVCMDCADKLLEYMADGTKGEGR